MSVYTESSIVSCYIDAASCLLMVLLLILSGMVFKNRSRSIVLFRVLCFEVVLTCIACFVFNAMWGRTSDISHLIAHISRSFWEFLAITANCMWLAYLEQKLFARSDSWKIKRALLIGVVILCALVLLINPFTGIVFTISKDNSLVRGNIYYVLFLGNFLIFLFSFFETLRYDRITEKMRFVRVLPMFLCAIIAVLPQYFTPYNTGISGYVVGAMLVYFSIISENYYLDEESGLYNKKFLTLLVNTAAKEKKRARSALLLETHGNSPEIFRILHTILHTRGDVIRYEKNRFLMFLNENNMSSMQYLSSLVDEAVSQHNASNSDDKISINIRNIVRSEKEDPLEFMRKAMDKNAESNEMKGIASMISELDRLDKELSMAADIQKSILPVDFPSRKEFELYASMTPAKEVGGDFYDFFLIDDDHLALVIADVSDKGVPAALFMMISKTLIKNNLMAGKSPAEALQEANHQLYEHNTTMMFVTIWLAVLEISTGKGISCNAGHEKPAIRRNGSPFELLDYEHDLFLGVDSDTVFTQREFEMHPEDTVLVYTDGVPEAANPLGQAFGDDNLLAALNKNADAAPMELIRNLRSSVKDFSKDAKQFDDLTILCLKYHGA